MDEAGLGIEILYRYKLVRSINRLCYRETTHQIIAATVLSWMYLALQRTLRLYM